MLTSRERVRMALNHQEPDKVPLDVGATTVSGIMAGALARLRDVLGLEKRIVKVHEPYQMLGFPEDDVLDALGVDAVGLMGQATMFGYPLGDWKPFALSDGTPVLVPGLFNTEPAEDGDYYQYPMGDKSVRPSGHMPAGGFFHDAVERQGEIDENDLDPDEWVKDMYAVYTDEEVRWLEERARDLYENTSRAIVGSFGLAGFGDIALVPGLAAAEPKGIRGVADWYMATVLYPDYVHGIFERQCEIGLKNLELYHQAVGDRIETIFMGGTDFGTQNGPFISPRAYREMYMPYHKRLNDWVHEHTSWKTWYHSCGSMIKLYDLFVEAGVDVVNPVQISAAGMAPQVLKDTWGDKLVFWGGGVDTQHALPFGTPEEIDAQVKENMEIFGKGGGFVFNAVHNIQTNVSAERLEALFTAVDKYR